MIIRKANEIDILSVMQIQSEGNLSFWSNEDYLAELKQGNSIFLIAQNLKDSNEQIITGFLLARSVSEEETDLLNFGVLNKYQRMGIGKELWEEFSRILKSNLGKSVWLEVRESNLNAIKFYRKRGFIEVQKRSNYYKNPEENALIMKLDLQ